MKIAIDIDETLVIHKKRDVEYTSTCKNVQTQVFKHSILAKKIALQYIQYKI